MRTKSERRKGDGQSPAEQHPGDFSPGFFIIVQFFAMQNSTAFRYGFMKKGIKMHKFSKPVHQIALDVLCLKCDNINKFYLLFIVLI